MAKIHISVDDSDRDMTAEQIKVVNELMALAIRAGSYVTMTIDHREADERARAARTKQAEADAWRRIQELQAQHAAPFTMR